MTKPNDVSTQTPLQEEDWSQWVQAWQQDEIPQENSMKKPTPYSNKKPSKWTLLFIGLVSVAILTHTAIMMWRKKRVDASWFVLISTTIAVLPCWTLWALHRYQIHDAKLGYSTLLYLQQTQHQLALHHSHALLSYRWLKMYTGLTAIGVPVALLWQLPHDNELWHTTVSWCGTATLLLTSLFIHHKHLQQQQSEHKIALDTLHDFQEA